MLACVFKEIRGVVGFISKKVPKVGVDIFLPTLALLQCFADEGSRFEKLGGDVGGHGSDLFGDIAVGQNLATLFETIATPLTTPFFLKAMMCTGVQMRFFALL